MHAGLPWLPRFFGGRTHLATLDAGQEHARQARLAGMILTVHGAKVEEFFAEGVALFLLGEDVLEGESQVAKTHGFKPGAIVVFVGGELEIGEEAAATVRAFFEAGDELIGESLGEDFELIGGDFVARVHAICVFQKEGRIETRIVPQRLKASFCLRFFDMTDRARKKLDER
jgi:hypothetical protein